jgi:ADP-heptose:LPS heptosyltransferase
MGHEVHVLVGREARAWIPILDGWEAVAATIVDREGTQPRAKFDRFFRTRWGPNNKWLAPYTREIGTVEKSLKDTHEADANMTPAFTIGWQDSTPPTHVECDYVPDGGGYIVFLTGCNPLPLWDRKRWPADRWDMLASRLNENVVFLGAKSDSRPWMKDIGEDRCGLPLRESLGRLKNARLAVGIDCGLGHCAGALNVPLVVLNGCATITKNRPLGSRVSVILSPLPCAPCQYTPRWKTCKKPSACMEAIEMDEVVKEASAWL